MARELPLIADNGLPKCRCHICGHEFDPVLEVNVCPRAPHYGESSYTPEDLITEDDDYAWCV